MSRPRSVSYRGACRAFATAGISLLLMCAGVGAAVGSPWSMVDVNTPARVASPVIDTQWGPLSQDDQTLLIKVRQADLWEGGVSTKIAALTTNPTVRAVATQLASDHAQLDQLDASTAAQLGVVLPVTPLPMQQQWEQEILAKTGAARDALYANLVRAAHGTVFMFVSKVRAETQNDLIRSFAQTVDQVVMRHMTLLESTDMVTMNNVLMASSDGDTVQPMPTQTQIVLGAGVAVLVMAGTFWLVRASSRRTAMKAQG